MYPHTTVGAAARLADLMGLYPTQYLAVTGRMNAWHDGERKLTRHEAIPRLDGSFAYFQQQRDAGDSYLVIVVGNEAMRVMPQELQDMKWGDTRMFLSNVEVLFLPHTSGVNRVWNNSGFSRDIREITRAVVSKYL